MDRFANPDRTLLLLQHGGHGRRRHDAGQGGAAPRHQPGRPTCGAEIRSVRRGQAIPAQSIIAPGGYGYDPTYRSENSEYDVARAKALLDMYGYVDRDGDGWRELPDGKPLVIDYATQPSAIDRQFDELWQKNMTAIGVRLHFKTAQWPEQLKAAQAG